MDKLTELGTARGHALRAVEHAKRELARAEAEFTTRDQAYQQHLHRAERYYHVFFSEDDGEWVATVDGEPFLSWLAPDPIDALTGLIATLKA